MDDKEYEETELEIQKIDEIINQKVYELYGLTKEKEKLFISYLKTKKLKQEI